MLKLLQKSRNLVHMHKNIGHLALGRLSSSLQTTNAMATLQRPSRLAKKKKKKLQGISISTHLTIVVREIAHYFSSSYNLTELFCSS